MSTRTKKKSDTDISLNQTSYPDVKSIPVNGTGTFINGITEKCPFCPQRFDRPDEYYLHQAEKHAKFGIGLFGFSNHDANTSSSTNLNDNIIENGKSSSIIRSRRSSCAKGILYNMDEIDTSSSDSEMSDEMPDNPNCHDENESEKSKTNQDEGKRNELENQDLSSSSDKYNFDLGKDIQNILQKYFKKITKKVKTMINEAEKRRKIQMEILYKCNICSLHFLDTDQLYQHLESKNHTDIQKTQCEYCHLDFTPEMLRQHINNNTKNQSICRNTNYKIISCTDSSLTLHKVNISENNNNEIGVTSSELDNSKNSSKKPSIIPEQIVKNKCVERSRRKRVRKILLYKCDECDEHFDNKNTANRHAQGTTHYNMNKNTICDVCTYKFSSKPALLVHKKLYHNQNRNLCKEDFKVIPLSDMRFMNSGNRKLSKTSVKTHKQIQINVQKKTSRELIRSNKAKTAKLKPNLNDVSKKIVRAVMSVKNTTIGNCSKNNSIVTTNTKDTSIRDKNTENNDNKTPEHSEQNHIEGVNTSVVIKQETLNKEVKPEYMSTDTEIENEDNNSELIKITKTYSMDQEATSSTSSNVGGSKYSEFTHTSEKQKKYNSNELDMSQLSRKSNIENTSITENMPESVSNTTQNNYSARNNNYAYDDDSQDTLVLSPYPCQSIQQVNSIDNNSRQEQTSETVDDDTDFLIKQEVSSKHNETLLENNHRHENNIIYAGCRRSIKHGSGLQSYIVYDNNEFRVGYRANGNHKDKEELPKTQKLNSFQKSPKKEPRYSKLQAKKKFQSMKDLTGNIQNKDDTLLIPHDSDDDENPEKIPDDDVEIIDLT